MNLDLSRIGHTESVTTGDGNNLSNIYGIRFETSGYNILQIKEEVLHHLNLWFCSTA